MIAMKKLFFAAPAMLLFAGCTALHDASNYVQGVLKAAPEGVTDAVRMILNLLMSVFNGVLSNFFNHLIPQ